MLKRLIWGWLQRFHSFNYVTQPNTEKTKLSILRCRGQNPIHILGQFGKENAAAIFDLFIECMPKYPIDLPDINGNTG